MEELIRNNDRRLELAERARRRAMAFSPSRMGNAYLSAYRRLLRTEAGVDLIGAQP